MPNPLKPSRSQTVFGRFASKRFAIIFAIVLAFLLIAIWTPF